MDDRITFLLVICYIILCASLCACTYIKFIMWHSNRNIIRSARRQVAPLRMQRYTDPLPVAIATKTGSQTELVATIVVTGSPL